LANIKATAQFAVVWKTHGLVGRRCMSKELDVSRTYRRLGLAEMGNEHTKTINAAVMGLIILRPTNQGSAISAAFLLFLPGSSVLASL